MRLTEIEKILAATVTGSVGDGLISMITADSRRVVAGTLFVAVRGHDGDGHDFIDQALKQGCIGVVGEKKPDWFAGSIPFFKVSDSRHGLGLLAAGFYGNPADKLTLIGITGTNGKTTTSWILEAILRQAGLRTGVIGTVNYRYQNADGKMVVRPAPLTTPDPLQLHSLLKEMVEAGVTHVITEASSHALHQGRLAGLLFSVALFTNLSRDHLDYHRDMDDYFSAKKILFSSCLQKDGVSMVVVDPENSDDYGSRLAGELKNQKVVRVGLDESCQVFADNLDLSIEGSSFTLSFLGKGVREKVSSLLIGKHNVLNEIGAAGVAFALDIEIAHIREAIGKLETVPGRLERVFPGGEYEKEDLPAVFVDYAHTPSGLESVLATILPLNKGRLVCVFGCGGDRDKGKRPLMGEIAGRLADIVVVTSDNPRSEVPREIIAEIEFGIKGAGRVQKTENKLFGFLADRENSGGYMIEDDRRRAIHLACGGSKPGDVVVIAGKGHEEYQVTACGRDFFSDLVEVKNGFAAWTVDNLVKGTGGKLFGDALPEQIIFSEISTDTRLIKDGGVFVALRGENYDGHDFISDAVAKGARAIVVEEPPHKLTGNAQIIVVEDTLAALGDLAGFRRQLLGENLKVIGITGSSGKTTLKEMTAAILTEFYNGDNGSNRQSVLKTEGNFNNLVGLPLSLLPLSGEHLVAVMEMGMSKFGEIGRMTEIADPDIACINNVHAAHLEGVGNLEGVARAKGELFENLRAGGLRIVNFDDPFVVKLAKKYPGPEIGFAVTAKGRERKPLVRVTRITSLGEQGSRFTLHIGEWQERITIPVPGIHNVHNAAAATAICHGSGVDKGAIIRGLGHHAKVDKRMQFMEMPGGLQVLDDSYNANPSSMAAALRTVASFGDKSCRRVAALGDMLELGDEAKGQHREIGRLLATIGYDMIAVTGEYSEQYLAGARDAGMSSDQMMRFVETLTMADWLYHLLIAGRLGEGDWLLVKGSRGMRMETLLSQLQNRFDPALRGEES
jgi:murE/murF fusion protein